MGRIWAWLQPLTVWSLRQSRGDSGRIIVGQPDDGRFIVYDHEGKRIATFGRPGAGPGEFRSIPIDRGWVDSVFWQFDLDTRRVTSFTTSGTLQRSDLIQLTGTSGSGINLLLPSVIAVRPDRSMLIWSPIVKTGPASGWASVLPPSAGLVVLEAGARGEVRRVVAAWPALYAGCDQQVNGRLRPTPECQSWISAVSPHGQYLAYVNVREEGSGQQAVIVSLTPVGDTAFTRTETIVPLPIGRTAADSIRDARITATRNPELKRDWRDIKLPRFFISVTNVVAADDGTIWVRVRHGRDGFLWHEIASDGRSERLWRLPPNVRLDVVTADHLYGIETDEVGFDNVVRVRR